MSVADVQLQATLTESEFHEQAEAESRELSLRVGELQQLLESAQSDIEARAGDMSLQQGELEQLRAELEAEQETTQRLTAQLARDSREHDRATSDLRWQTDSLRTQLADQEAKIRSAFNDRAMSSATTADVQSRMSTYLGEVDRLKVSEARLQSEVSDLRHASSGDALKIAELEKRVKELEEDKELLDISLDNKQTEITLLHRQASRSGARSVTPNRKRLTASTSRIPSTPSSRADATPMPERRLSISMHGSAVPRPSSAASSTVSSALKARRESVVPATPIPTKSMSDAGHVTVLARRPSITTPTPAPRAVLGSTTRHNRGGSEAESKIPGGLVPRKSVAGTEKAGLKRQTSLPSLARASLVSRIGQRPLDGMAEVDELDCS